MTDLQIGEHTFCGPEWHYNTLIHSSTGLSLFQVVYGKPHSSIPTYIRGTTNIEALDSELTTREELFQLFQQNLCKSQSYMKKFAGKHLTHIEFSEGDWVFVKLHPY